MPTAAADATAVSHSSMPWTSTTGGLVSTGHSSVLVVPVALSMATVRTAGRSG
jgi:hypothetical protein